MSFKSKPRIRSTFFSLNAIDTEIVTDNFLEVTQRYIGRILSYLSFRWITNIKSLHKYFYNFYKPLINEIPKTISDLHRLHNHTQKKSTNFNIANLYKSNISTIQTAQHPILPDFQMICVDNIPLTKEIPFDLLDYKFNIYKTETGSDNFNDHTFVRYHDFTVNEDRQVTRTEFMERRQAKKKSVNPPGENVIKKKQKKIRNSHLYEMTGRSVVCKINKNEGLYLKLSEVDIL